MSVLTKMAGLLSGNGDAVAKPVEALGTAFDTIFTSDEERMTAEAVLVKLRQHPMELQAALNMMDAQSRFFFNSGWRPMIGWVCGLALALYYLPQFTMANIMWVRLCWKAKSIAAFPIQDISGLLELVVGMLGLGVLRTVEKFGKVTR